MKNYALISKITLWCLMAVGIIVSVMFFFVGGYEAETMEVAGDVLQTPANTNAFLVWGYILFAATIVATLYGVCVGLIQGFKKDPKKTTRGLLFAGVFFIILIVCWVLGSPAEVRILGYEGDGNVGVWAQMSDAVLYAIYVLLCAFIAVVIWGAVYTRLRK
ncbi:MAG: hypothetical protein IJ756_03105 [Paludibacteraceae bacterium]|nr:hypothetical protein [Paludibacteraceae bacterium]MBR1786134.1 hypothetical protein [Paludibacteraceae bacterium]